MRFHIALTSVLPYDDPHRFNMGTPDEVESTLRRCWEVAPTSQQIVADIVALPRVLDKIFAAEGCVVPDEFLRSGRRERRADDSGDLTSRMRPRQRIETNADLVIHPDCHDLEASMLAGEYKVERDAAAEVAGAEEYDDDDDRASQGSGFED